MANSILVIDDNEVTLKLVRATLQANEHEIHCQLPIWAIETEFNKLLLLKQPGSKIYPIYKEQK